MNHPDRAQEELFISTVNGWTVVRDVDAQQQGAVPMSEHYAHLINALTLHDDVLEHDRKARLYPMPKNPEAGYKPTREQSISLNAAETAEQIRADARGEFYGAYGLTAMKALEDSSELKAGKAYNAFTKRFAGAHKAEKRQQAREKWSSLLGSLIGVNTDSVADDKATTNESKEPIEPGLSTREKLIVLAEAHDAGFLPTTNEEKNTATAYLDYLLSGKFELGTQSQLLEVGNFHGRHHDYESALEFALQAGRSIAHEFGDWYTQAKKQLAELQEVQELLYEVDNPNLSLAVALNANMLKAVPIIRYMDLLALRAGAVEHQTEAGAVQPKFDILRTRRNESEDLLIPGKNKVLEDPYTGRQLSKAAKKWIKMRLEQVKVKDVRDLITDAVQDQTRRVAFHELILKDLATEKADSDILNEAGSVARSILGGEQQV